MIATLLLMFHDLLIIAFVFPIFKLMVYLTTSVQNAKVA